MGLNTGSVSGRIREVDGLRGVAILLVVSFHYINNQLIDNSDIFSKVLTKMTSYGWVGVDLFFVLSGFLIGNILISKRLSPNYFTTFYVRRIVRIIPNYFLLLIIFSLIWVLPYFSRNYFFADKGNIPLWTYFLMIHNLFMAHYDSLGNRALSVTWSIGIEEQFYLIFPFIIYYLRLKWLPIILIILIIGASVFRSFFNTWVPQYVLLPARMDGLALGILVAYAYSEGLLFKHKYILNKILKALLLSLVIIMGYIYLRYNDLGLVKFTIFGLIFAIILVFALNSYNSWYGAVLRSKILSFTGTISYSLYLFHYAILGLIFHFFGKNGIGIHSRIDIIISLMAILTSILFGWCIYKYFEQPMVRFGKNWKY